MAALIIVSPHFSFGQATLLSANGRGDTYYLINSVLAPGHNAIETPDCVHTDFGKHISEAWDDDLKAYVFEFHSHLKEDNDRCMTFDRQRTEIKTYKQSPAKLIGTVGETVTYKWKFKIPAGFKASPNFTHLHQVKPVNGSDESPLFTLTVRKGSPNKMELIHKNSDRLAVVNLSLFEGRWVEVTEVIKVGVNGAYAVQIQRLSDSVNLINYSNTSILTIRADNEFIRPKWGIYRSLINAHDLRDEVIRFNDFGIEEAATPSVQ